MAAGADVDARGKDGQTALMIMARGNGVAAARVLLEHGADVNAQETWREQTAADLGSGCKSSPKWSSCCSSSARIPMRAPSRTNWQRQVSGEKRRLFRPFGGLTALLYAAREGCVECARALVEGGADIDLSGYRGITPLIMALDNYHFDLAAYLVDAGASLDVWDWWGRIAALHGRRHAHAQARRPARFAVDGQDDGTPSCAEDPRERREPESAGQAAAAAARARQGSRLRLAC